MNYDLMKGLVNSFLGYYNSNGFYGVRRWGEILKKENNDSLYRALIDVIMNSFEEHGYTGHASEGLREGELVKKLVMRDFGFREED